MPLDPQTIRKAALLVSSLDTDAADTLLEQMPGEHAEAIRRALLAMDQIDEAEQDAVIADFLQAGSEHLQPAEDGGVELAGNLARPSKTPLEPPHMEAERPPFRFLQAAASGRLTPLLAGEHPQTIALVLSHLPAGQALEVLSELPAAQQAECLRRLVELDEAQPEFLREVERGLESRIGEHTRRQRQRNERLELAANILDAADPDLERKILNNLARLDPRLAASLARPAPEFEDLERLPDGALWAVVQAAGLDLTILALAGASSSLSQRVLRLMPPEAARSLARSIDALGPTRLSDVAAAQQELAAAARRLAAAGRNAWAAENPLSGRGAKHTGVGRLSLAGNA